MRTAWGPMGLTTPSSASRRRGPEWFMSNDLRAGQPYRRLIPDASAPLHPAAEPFTENRLRFLSRRSSAQAYDRGNVGHAGVGNLLLVSPSPAFSQDMSRLILRASRLPPRLGHPVPPAPAQHGGSGHCPYLPRQRRFLPHINPSSAGRRDKSSTKLLSFGSTAIPAAGQYLRQ